MKDAVTLQSGYCKILLFYPLAPRCTAFDGPINGTISLTALDYAYGTTISISCNEGFDLIGEGNITCTSDLNNTGIWSPNQDGIKCGKVIKI